MSGDIDCDGVVDAVDALRILRHVVDLGNNLPDGCDGLGAAAAAAQPQGAEVKGDVDCDGEVDAVDALRILRHVVQLPTNIPADCTPIGSVGFN
jgi:hypothetical protein